MPRYAYPHGILNGLASGGSKLFQAILNADRSYQQGYDREALNQSRIAQAAGAAAENDAQAANWRAKTAVIERRPDLYEEQAALASGYDVPTVRALRQTVAGNRPQVPMGPPTESGDMGVGSFQIDQEGRSKISMALQQYLPLLANSGDLKPDDLAQAAKTYDAMGLQKDVLAGQRTAQSVNEAVAAAAGKLAPGGGNGKAGVGIKAPTGFQWDASGQRLEPIPGGPRDPSVQPQKAGKGSPKEIDRDRVAILSQELFDIRERMQSAQGAELTRLQADEAAVVAEIKGLGVKDVGQLALPKAANAQAAKKPPTEGQSKALMFGTRMAIADEILAELQSAGTERSGFIKGLAQGVAGAVPIVGDSLRQGAGALTNWSQSAKQQKVEQAKRDFINAVLRRESGAVIGQDEFENTDQQYFPQLGDSDAVIKQKAANRRTAIDGMKAEFGEPLMPDFLRTVRGARAERQKSAKGENRPGAQTGIYTAPAAPVQRTITVDY